MHQNQLSTLSVKELPARTMTMHHVCLVVSDIAATRDFYVNVLGFEEIHRPTDFVFHGAYFQNGDVEVHVVRETEPGRLARNTPGWEAEELRTGLCHHFAVLVDSFEPFLAAMRERGLERVGGPRVRDDYVEQIYIADPDGHVIELLCQHTPEAGHARRIEIFDLGIAVPVAPGYPVTDPRAKYGVLCGG
ncbi:glyoxalase/Bleomycin resistance protein/dioxygenase [Arthrobacter sp. Hiyo1]|uniref:VOC family protein n=1 Tax=Arthrobacter sp. Hiyo1 TaxID=1588020 RepID=UPI0006A3D3A8|nr:VOC family protein [Arthrobacter sp. Hiyo1]GAP60641.1 glyoxalase/Bleomycin resistance protein/dioxygenase [Arthrobacter sp. Hiyo1]